MKWLKRVIVAILIAIAAFFGVKLVVSSQKAVTFSWDDYLATGGSPDVAFLRIYEVDRDTIIVRTVADSIDYQLIELHTTLSKQDRILYFVATAIDTAGNESDFSNVALLDWSKPGAVTGFRAD